MLKYIMDGFYKKSKEEKMKYKEMYTVTSHDVDLNNNLRPTMALRYMQETAHHQMRDRKPSYYDLFLDGKSFVVTRMTVEIFEQVHQYEEIEVNTWRCQEKGATFVRCFSIAKEGHIAMKAYSSWAVVNKNTGRLCRANEVDISNYETDEPYKMNLSERFRLPTKLEYEKVGERMVFYSDVDMNMHMNNTNYPNMLCDHIPDIMHKEVTSLNLRFMAEGSLGKTLEIYRSKAQEPLAEDKNAQLTYYFYTKVGEKTNVEAEIGVRKI